MRTDKPPLHGEITSSTIDSFSTSTGSSASGQLFAGLAAANLEVGLVLHFGKKACFDRVFFENRFKHRNR